MSNIRKFPGRGPSKTGQGARDTGFQVVGLDGKPVDVLVQIVHAGGVFLIPMQEGASEEPPTAQLLRTISSFDAFTDGANALIAYVRNHLVALFIALEKSSKVLSFVFGKIEQKVSWPLSFDLFVRLCVILATSAAVGIFFCFVFPSRIIRFSNSRDNSLLISFMDKKASIS